MARNFYDEYPSNTAPSDSNYPVGKARNESWDGAKDYFPLEETWVNELLGFWGALLDEVGASPDGQPENVAASQYLDAIKAIPVPLSRLDDGTGTVEDGSLTLGTVSQGIMQLSGSSSAPAKLTSYNNPSGVYNQKVHIENGRIWFENGLGIDQGFTSILYPISYSFVSTAAFTDTYQVTVANGATGIALPNVANTQLRSVNLILQASAGLDPEEKIVTIPLLCQTKKNTGNGQIIILQGTCTTHLNLNLANWDLAYLQFYMDPNALF